MNLRVLFGLGLLLVATLANAQMPRLAWQHTAAPIGDGTRAYLLGDAFLPGPFPTFVPVRQPGFDPRTVVASDDGAYLIIPVNGGGGSENLAYLMTPFWLSNKGWQVMRMDASGQQLWSRFVSASITAYAPLPATSLSFGGEAVLLQARRTAAGGLAMLNNSGLQVFDPEGKLTFAGDVRATTCRPPVEDFSQPSVQVLTDEDVVLLGVFSSTTPRACAIDFAGVEIERVTSTSTHMEVADYRLAFGFLVKEGSWSMGSWTSATLSLRNASGVRWSKPDMLGYFAAAYPQISPSGEAWLFLDLDMVKLDVAGNVSWQRPLSEFDETTHVAWLSDGGRVLANDNPNAVQVLNSNGSTRWRRELPGLTDPGVDVNWLVSADRVRMAGYRESDRQGRVVSLQLTDGAVSSDQLMSWGHDRPHTAFGLLANDQAIAVAESSSSLTRFRESNQPCDRQGYCPYSAHFAKPDVRTYAASSGTQTGALNADSFGFPLSAFPLERRQAARPLFGETEVIGLLHTQYVHDGVRNNARIERLARNGQVDWTRTLGFSDFDAGGVSVYHRPEAVYVSASEFAPLNTPSTPRVWKLSSATGDIEWQRDLPFAVQQLRPLFAPVGGGVDVCSISTEWPHRLACVSAAGTVSESTLVGAPADRRLDANGSRVVNGDLHLLVRAVRLNGAFSSSFEFATISRNGTYVAESVRQFETVTGTEFLRTDAFDHLTQLATAGIYANGSGFGRPQSLVVAKFDVGGARLWQHRFDVPLRGFGDTSDNTAVAEAANGDVYVAMHPAVPLDASFPTRVCRLSAAGAALGCFDSPRQGRVINLFALGAGNGIWAWQRGLTGGNYDPLAMYLYRVDAQGFGPQELRIASHTAFTHEALSFDGKFGYFVLGGNGAGSHRAADTKLVSIQLNQLPLFFNGFEE